MTLRKGHFFVILVEKYVEDVKQDQKNIPHLLESIMRPTDPVKEELLRILSQMRQFRTQIQEFRVYTFWMWAKITDFRWRLPAGAK